MTYTKDMLDEALSTYVNCPADHLNTSKKGFRVEQVLAIRRYISELEEIKWMYEELQK
jgi:hypothetical protein